MRWRGVFGFFGVLLLSASVAVLPSHSAPSEFRVDLASTGAAPTGSPACQGVLGAWDINSTMFFEICNEPSFQSAYAQRGLQDFTPGGGGGRGWEDDFYGFDWSAPCHNVSWRGNECEEQEYWIANLTTNNVSGPFYEEGPASCAGCPSVSPAYAPIVLLPGLATIGTAFTLLAVLAVRGRRRRRDPSVSPGGASSAPQTPTR